MATPKLVSKRLREMLGGEAAETMVEWLDGLETDHDSLRHELRADIASFRQEMVASLAELRAEMVASLAELRAEMRAGFAAVDTKFAAVDAKFAATDAKIAAVDAKNAERLANLLKWMIGFWLGSLAGIVTTILALGRPSK